MNQRKLSLIAVVALLALVGAGCGSSKSKSGSSGASKQSEAQSAAAGDIPDNQVFLTYTGQGYSIKYPEGWSRSGSASNVTFSNKANAIHLVLSQGGSGSGRSPKQTHTQRGAPDPVTGKRPLLIIDRYVYSQGGRKATLDLVTPKGVDNVDAYRLISKSFKWR